jgi:hypothetical protein
MTTNKTSARDLADRLVTEYAGALPPGQVLAIVHRASARRVGVPGLTPEVRLELCEQSARRALTDRIAWSAAPVHAA